MNVFSIFGSLGLTSASHNGWTPANIANLEAFLHFKEGNCYVNNGGAASIEVGKPVVITEATIDIWSV